MSREDQIKAAILTDPTTYGPLRRSAPDAKPDAHIADRLNEPGPEAPTADIRSIAASDFMALVAVADWNAPQRAADRPYVETLLSTGTILVNAITKAGILAMFPTGTATRTAMDVRFRRQKTRGEVSGIDDAIDEPVRIDEVNRARNL